MRITHAFAAFAFSLLVPLLAFGTPPGFSDLPTDAGKKSPIKLKIIQYSGSTNGGMEVEVVNTAKTPQSFTAQGLFFVPNMNPEDAPQRLGAAGPFEVKNGNAWRDEENLELKPGQRARLKLSLFCIDSHRGSPSTATPFRLAKERLPKQIRQEIEKGTKALLKAKKVNNAKHIKGDVQGHVWKTRDANWIPVEGERKQEKTNKKHPNQMQRRIDNRNMPMQQRLE